MKLKHGIIILASGYILDFIGAWMKITHQLYANEALGISALLKVIGIIVIVARVLRHPAFKDM